MYSNGNNTVNYSSLRSVVSGVQCEVLRQTVVSEGNNPPQSNGQRKLELQFLEVDLNVTATVSTIHNNNNNNKQDMDDAYHNVVLYGLYTDFTGYLHMLGDYVPYFVGYADAAAAADTGNSISGVRGSDDSNGNDGSSGGTTNIAVGDFMILLGILVCVVVVAVLLYQTRQTLYDTATADDAADDDVSVMDEEKAPPTTTATTAIEHRNHNNKTAAAAYTTSRYHHHQQQPALLDQSTTTLSGGSSFVIHHHDHDLNHDNDCDSEEYCPLSSDKLNPTNAVYVVNCGREYPTIDIDMDAPQPHHYLDEGYGDSNVEVQEGEFVGVDAPYMMRSSNED